LFFENKKWRATKKSSPKPDDFKHGNKDHCWVGHHAIYDTTLGTLVRFGWEEVAVLGEDEVWSLHKPKQYKSLVSERRWGHVPAHDPQTGETLLVDFSGDERTLYDKAIARVIRFDLARCEQIATIEYPFKKAKQHDAAPYHSLAETFSYDPSTKSLYAQVVEDNAGAYRLDLAPAFSEAKGLGPRTVPKKSEKPAPKEKAKKPAKK